MKAACANLVKRSLARNRIAGHQLIEPAMNRAFRSISLTSIRTEGGSGLDE
jgi:hypothetical protein